jgi:hypothetical protein
MAEPKDSIIHPRPEELLPLNEEELTVELVREWDRQLERAPPDLERLLGGGQIAARRGLPGIEERLLSWLQAGTHPRRWDVAGCFLMGFWPRWPEASPTLARQILEGLLRSSTMPGAPDTLIIALASAYPRMPEPEATDIRDRFERLRRSASGPDYQKAVQRALAAVLDHPAASVV